MNRVKKIARRWEQQRPDAIRVLASNKRKTNSNRWKRRAEEARNRRISGKLNPCGDVVVVEGLLDEEVVRLDVTDPDVIAALTNGVVLDNPATVDDIFSVYEVSAVVDPPNPHTSVDNTDPFTVREVDRISEMSRDDLVAAFKNWGLKGHSRMNKRQLQEAIIDAWASSNNLNAQELKELLK